MSPCLPLHDGRGHRVGSLCVGNEPVSVTFNGRTYRFEWTAACGWIPVNQNGSERLSGVPDGAWDALEATEEAKER